MKKRVYFLAILAILSIGMNFALILTFNSEESVIECNLQDLPPGVNPNTGEFDYMLVCEDFLNC